MAVTYAKEKPFVISALNSLHNSAIRARLENRPDPVLYDGVERLVSMISLAISA
jgi:hypothetical protein